MTWQDEEVEEVSASDAGTSSGMSLEDWLGLGTTVLDALAPIWGGTGSQPQVIYVPAQEEEDDSMSFAFLLIGIALLVIIVMLILKK